METSFFDSNLFIYVLLPVLIFMARICDVSIGTLQILNGRGYGATVVEAHGARENIDLIYSIVKRNELADVLDIISQCNPKAFYTIEDVKAVNEGIFTQNKPNSIFPLSNVLRLWRRGK